MFKIFTISAVLLLSYVSIASDKMTPSSVTNQEEFNLLILEEFRSIVTTYYNQIESANKSNVNQVLTILSSGYWYPNDFYDQLIKHKENERIAKLLAWLINTGSFRNGHIDPKHAYLQLDGNREKKTLQYLLKPNVKPSDAIKNLSSHRLFIDCQIAYQIAYYRAALVFLNQSKFDEIFSVRQSSPAQLEH